MVRVIVESDMAFPHLLSGAEPDAHERSNVGRGRTVVN